MSELEKHRISRAQLIHCESRYPRLIGRNATRGVHGYGGTLTLVELHTDRGATGWGLTENGVRTDALPGRLVSELIDPDSGILAASLHPFDLALHDLAGRILEKPVYALLGAREGRPIRCYDGAIYLDDILPDGGLGDISIILDNCRRDWERNFRDFKLKIGRHRWMRVEQGLQRDIDVTRAVRQRFPEARILVDGNDGFTAELFLRYFSEVAGCNLYWIEEPFVENREGLLRVRELIARRSPKTLIADGEAYPDLDVLLPLVREGLIDVLLMDVYGFGVTRWRQLIREIGTELVQVSPHAWGTYLKTCYAANVAAAWQAPVVEGAIDAIAGLDLGGYQLRDGLLTIPEAHGFGAKPTTKG